MNRSPRCAATDDAPTSFPQAPPRGAVPAVGVQASAPAELLPLLWQLDGGRPVGELLTEGDDALSTIRRLLELGFLAPNPTLGPI